MLIVFFGPHQNFLESKTHQRSIFPLLNIVGAFLRLTLLNEVLKFLSSSCFG